MTEKPFSRSSERNRESILAVLQRHFADRQRVLEIGSGTGQHAVHFAAALPRLLWQSADREIYLPGIRRWLAEAALPNTPDPLAFDVNDEHWPTGPFDAVFSANTLHIMSWAEVERLFARLPQIVTDGAKLVIYGPFNYQGRFTSDSNAAFDARLRGDAAHMGIRDFEAVDALAGAAGFTLQEDCAMPANNRCLVWSR